MKNGGKKAVKLFDRQEEADLMAEEKGKDHYVEFRQGESIKCSHYCQCRQFCNYYNQALNLKELPKAA
jgi:hypothetical protein